MKTTVFEKSKEKLATVKKGAAALAVGGSAILAGAMPVFAAEGGDGAVTAITSGMSSAATSMTDLVGKAVPIVVPIMTAVLVVKFGMKLFKQLSGRAG